eukprot:TRINITY_DN103643_c0_g1_i1.p1 TRINITY_DN103643_c0_g1~~TRINITY_DN103643_c0_g1_i1.p1  ORF type:complete len:104 (-),score=14.62 TRINITY_DN103643_c0_g1_i1:137-424(-)
MQSWNVAVNGSRCCPFHEYVAKQKDACRMLSQMKSMKEFPAVAPTGYQCQECGRFAMEDEDDKPDCCIFCDSRDFKLYADDDGELVYRTQSLVSL